MKLDVMDASQAFKATQAASSPLIHVIHSDGLSERPSPDMYNIRPATAGSLSSPTRMTTFGAVRAAIEPQTTYISMQESQAERDNRLKQAALRQQGSTSESSNDDFDSDDSQLRRRRLQRQIDLKAKGDFLGLTAPRRSGPTGRGRGQGKRKLGQHSPAGRDKNRSGKRTSEALIISDEISAEENITEDETDQEMNRPESVDEDIDEIAEDNKENVEVPRTVTKEYRRRAAGLVSESQPPHHLPRNIGEIQSLEPIIRPEMMNQTHRASADLRIDPGTQTSAIADSQLSPNQGNPGHVARAILTDASQSADPYVDIPQSPPPNMVNVSSIRKATFSTLTRFDSFSPGEHVMHTAKDGGSPILVKSRAVVDGMRTGALPTEAETVPSSAPPAVDHKTSAAIFEDTKLPQKLNIQNAMQPREQVTSEKSPHMNGPVEVNAKQDKPEPRTIIPASSSNEIPSSTLPSEIPETSSAIRRPVNSNDTLRLAKARSPGSSTVTRPLSDSLLAGATPFETAQTRLTYSSHISQPPRSPSKPWQMNSSSGQSSLPLKTFGQIAADPSPLDPIGEVDLEINLLSNEDVEFQNVINGSSPPENPAKRRRHESSNQIFTATEPEQSLRREPESKPGPVPVPVPVPLANLETGLQAERNRTPHSHDSIREFRKSLEQDPSAVDELADENLSATATIVAAKVQSADRKTPGDGDPVKRKAKSPQGKPRKVRPLEVINTGRSPGKSKDKLKDSAPKLNKSSSSPSNRSNPRGFSNGTANESTIVAPNRVFAYFNGNRAAFYPATCIGVVGGNEPRLKVRFDDGTVDTIGQIHVRRLELCVGDLIKVDSSGSRTTTYVVQGLSDSCLAPGKMSQSCTDVYGNATILASMKKGLSGDAHDLDAKTFSIRVTDIYLTPGMWKNFKDRPFKFSSSAISGPSSALRTPSETTSTSSFSTSRGQRPKVSGMGNSRSSLTGSKLGRGLFENMVFAVTNIRNEEDRRRTTHRIESNGGQVLADGFTELFNIPELELVSSSDPSPKKPINSQFGLTPANQHIGFACLIADKHCRLSKYIQALALGIPCLATRWVQDCVTARRVLPWETYLLSSGESSFLGGAIRSRMLPAFSPTDITLASIVDQRPQLLAGESVLLVMSKAEEEILKNHPLFTYALGATRVSRVTTLEAAAKVLIKAYNSGEPWDWLYSHDNAPQAEKIIFGTNSGGRKRKRAWDDNGAEREGKQRTRVVGNEFLVQSLILGRLLDVS